MKIEKLYKQTHFNKQAQIPNGNLTATNTEQVVIKCYIAGIFSDTSRHANTELGIKLIIMLQYVLVL